MGASSRSYTLLPIPINIITLYLCIGKIYVFNSRSLWVRLQLSLEFSSNG